LKLSSLGYNIRQGCKNISRNKMFSIASIATMTACIFLFGVFFSIIMNVNAVRRDLEERVGVTVFFDEGISDYKIQQIGEDIKQLEHVTSVTFTSAEEAWSEYQKEYFDSTPELAEGFKDNPLANSASYTVLVDKIENQDTVVAAIQDIVGVRQVNQSSGAANTLKSFNRLFTYVSIGVIAILLVIAVILISNTINVGISVRKDEIAIMKLIGATDSFVRAPFVVEGFVLGLIGSLIPLAILYVSYGWLLSKILSRFGALSEMGDVLLTVNQVFFYLLPVGLILGVGIGLIGAIITVRKHLSV
jgi:cell division transport system permease protein